MGLARIGGGWYELEGHTVVYVCARTCVGCVCGLYVCRVSSECAVCGYVCVCGVVYDVHQRQCGLYLRTRFYSEKERRSEGRRKKIF